MGASQNYNVNLNINANAQSAERQLQNLQKQLQQISNMKVDVGVGNLTADIEQASQAAMKLSAHLATATNPQTGNLDFTKFYSSIQKSGASLQEYGAALQKMGPAGQKAFVSLADSISKSEIPLKRTSKMVDKMWDGLKRTAGWQLQSSIIHGIIGGVQQAVGYAKDLNKSLTDIRIVTGQSTDQMAKFAKEANKAAKNLNTTTTDYTRASLIYYQQGLSDAEVKARTETTIKMANATGTSAQKVSDQMTAIWNNYDNGTKSLTHYADVMTALGAATASSTDEIAQGLQKFASISNTVGLSYEYAASALATITAESRESADIVGNALKTLFSRIQGLQLGETLEDGTTLNKYSTALAKVGISIKDQAGGLKDMDDILDEMGSKWQTLERDEKMALAQTVAGVRQYTQLMTLMENWDDFKQNLNTANTSAGTLDAQAAIYAQSWEAASDRVRASWEGLWDNLINSDSFITILDGLSGIVNLLDGMVSGFGGAGGALLTFGGILTKVFNKQISQSISNAAYGIKMLMPGQQQKMIDERTNFISSAREILDKDSLGALGKDQEYATRRMGMENSLSASLLYAQNKDRMSAEQLMFESQYAQMAESAQEELLNASKSYDAARESRYDFFGKFYNKDMSFNALEKSAEEWKQEDERIKKIDAEIASKKQQKENLRGKANKSARHQLNQDLLQLQSDRNNLLQQIDGSIFKRESNTQASSAISDLIQKRQNEIAAIDKKYEGKKITEKDAQRRAIAQQSLDYLQGVKSARPGTISQAKDFRTALNDQGTALAKFNQTLSQVKNTGDAEQLLTGLSEFSATASNSMNGHTFISKLTELASSYDTSTDEGKRDFLQAFEESGLSNMQKTFTQQSMELVSGAIYDAFSNDESFFGKSMTREDFIAQANAAYMGTEEQRLAWEAKTAAYKDIVEKRQKNLEKQEAIKSGTEAIVSGASGAMEALAAGESLKALIESISTGTATLTSSLTGVTSMALNAASGFSGLESALGKIPGLGAGASAAIAGISTVLLTLIPIVTELIDNATISKKEIEQNLINSNSELSSITQETQSAVELAKTKNENYLKGLANIDTLAADPTQLAESIFESNKQALNLINEYGLSEVSDYIIGDNGLIKIKEASLNNVIQNKEMAAQISEYAEISGYAANNLTRAKDIYQEQYNDTSKFVNGILESLKLTDPIKISEQAMLSENYFATQAGLVISDYLMRYKDSITLTEVDMAKLAEDTIGLENAGAIQAGSWISKQIMHNINKNKNKFDFIDEITTEEIINAWTGDAGSALWKELKERDKHNQIDWKAMEDELAKITVANQKVQEQEIAVTNAARVIANRELSEKDITQTNQEGYQAYAEVVAKDVQQQLDSTDNNLIDGNTISDEEAVKNLLAQLGYKGAHNIHANNGIVYFTLDGESQERSYTGNTLNHHYAVNRMNSETAINKADRAWKDAFDNFKKFGEDAVEAGFHIQELGTISGASAESVQVLYNAGEKNFKSIYENKAIADAEYARVEEIFGDKGVVKNLGLDSAILSETPLSVLESLQNIMKTDDAFAQSIADLFTGIQKTGDGNPEKAAQLLTVLSNMDFSDNAYLNATSLLKVLEDLGYGVDEGHLPIIYEWLTKITNLAPNLNDSNDKISKNRGALNDIEPGSKVNTAKKEAAQEAGLVDSWVKSGEDEYTYIGKQESIDKAKAFQNEAWARNQMDINNAQKNKEKIEGSTLKGDYESIGDLVSQLGFMYDMDMERYVKRGANDNAQILADTLELSLEGLLNLINTNPQIAINRANSVISNTGISDETQKTQVQDFLGTKIGSAQDMMNAVNDAKARGDTAGFVDKNQVITKDAIGVLNTYQASSERTADALKILTEAEENYNAETGEGLAAMKQAEAYYNLQQSIDAVAAARGLDADLLAQQVSSMKESGDNQYYSAKSLAIMAAETLELNQALSDLNKNYKTLSKSLKDNKRGSDAWLTSMSKLKKSLGAILNINGDQLSDSFVLAAESSGLIEKALSGQSKDLAELRRAYSLVDAATKNYGKTNEEVNNYIQEHGIANIGNLLGEDGASFVDDWNTIVDGMKTMNWDEFVNSQSMQSAVGNVLSAMTDLDSGTQQTLASITQAAAGQGFEPVLEPVPVTPENGSITVPTGGIYWYGNANDPAGKAGTYENTIGSESVTMDAAEGSTLYKVSFKPLSGSSSSGGGGGGGGGGKPKKAANKRKSSTVKRYKRSDYSRSQAQSAKSSASTQKDYLYGESKIAQMEKINKLAEKEARITSDRIKESRKYMIEDRENLIKYMQKYGYEVEFDADGFLNTYEEAWTKIHDKIAKLYEDNEITDDEKELEEQYNVELEELEGALEDYENSLKELQEDIEAYEESLYEMYDNKVEQMQHKVEFKIELNEDDLSYLDFWIEALGDSLYNAIQSIETMGEKTNILFDGIDTYKQGIEDIYALSDDPLHTWATGGLDEVLTQDQVDALRENKDGLMDYMQQLIDLRETIQDKVLDTFDKWQEKLETTLSTIEHYGTVMEHFKNIIDIVGKDSLKLNNQFMSNLQQSTINQSMDNIEATKAHYESLIQTNSEAQKNLEEAIASGDQSRIEFWEEVIKTTNESMQSAQDALLSSLENTLNLIVEKFETAMEYAAEKFNDAIYAYGGLEGLENDYNLMREQADLMAADYDKIYQLNKINRNINKTLSDSNIIAGKQKMKSLQQEINELQASGVELSKYDLEYLQAKYELRLAEIELENAKNNKDTVRLSKDSEGNWSYIYTSSVDKVEEAQQKYEDALYNMQNLSYEYMEEMSSAMMATSLAMMEEIQALRIQDFNSYEDYEAEIERIQNKYAAVLKTQQDELNKTVSNNEQLYDEDWKNYNKATGYKISDSELWADKYSETTLGALLGSSESVADFADNIINLSDILIKDLGNSAIEYFANVDAAMGKYGTSINDFGSQVSNTVSNISNDSKTAAEDMKEMAQEMGDAFKEIADYVSDWQEEFSQQINDMLTEIGALVQSINEAIQKSAELAGNGAGAEDLIGSAEAAKLLNNHSVYDFGEWGFKGNQLVVDGKATSFIEENAKLINEINDKMTQYTNAETGSEEREQYGIELEALFKKYHAFKEIVGRIYDPSTLSALELEKPNYTSMDTGGYTGSWGSSGKFAMLHEKELVLNQDDTKNFLEALNISRDLINSMIEMNAKQASMAFGNLTPASSGEYAQILEQQVSIIAEFPNATDHNEIEEAFSNLINGVSQYANKYKD